MFPGGDNRREWDLPVLFTLATVLNEKLLRDAGINDKSRKVKIRGKQVIVPLKFDESGNIPSSPSNLVFKRLSLTDLRFLKIWKSHSWDVDKSVQESGLTTEKVHRLIKKLQCFRDEDAKVKALCEIPTAEWIKSKHVENIYNNGELEDSQQKSLAELAKIQGAYKNTAQLSITQNVFNLPKLTPEQEVKTREFFDAIAIEESSNAA